MVEFKGRVMFRELFFRGGDTRLRDSYLLHDLEEVFLGDI